MRWVMVLVGLLGCTSDPGLLVDMRTDYVGGVEFEAIEVSLDDGPFEPVILEHARNDYVDGVRVMRYPQVDTGVRRVQVRLTLGSLVVAERAAVVDVVETSAVTVVLTRSCRGVTCPAGDADATACLGGECVDPACNPETPGSCPAAQCANDGDCPSLGDCSAGRCVEGACLVGDDGSCGPDSFCHPTLGCRTTGSSGCPAYMIEMDGFCIDLFQSGDMTWVDATAYCESRGATLCSPEQWVEACNMAGDTVEGLTEGWEWTSELVTDTSALKHGAGDCTTTSPHQIDDGDYGVRCCANR